jgi:hypothetical protein
MKQAKYPDLNFNSAFLFIFIVDFLVKNGKSSSLFPFQDTATNKEMKSFNLIDGFRNSLK